MSTACVVMAVVAVGCCLAQTPSDQTPAPKMLVGPTLAAMIGGSLNSPMFRHWYVLDDKGGVKDDAEEGKYSCAFYVSVLLQTVGLADGVYPHMDHLMDSMKRCGWRELDEEEDDTDIMVVVWGTEYGNRHLGFAFADSEKAISHSSFASCPVRHDRVLRDGKTIARRWAHPDLAGDTKKYLRLHYVI